jgi:Arc/MetJ family transcription regulator
MRTNIDIDDDLLVKAMQAGPYTTKKETVEAACACWHARPPTAKSSSGKASSSGGDEAIDWTKPAVDQVASLRAC